MLTQNRSNTSEFPKRSSTRSRTSNKLNKPLIVVVAVPGENLEDGRTEDVVEAEGGEGVDEGEEDHECGRKPL